MLYKTKNILIVSILLGYSGLSLGYDCRDLARDLFLTLQKDDYKSISVVVTGHRSNDDGFLSTLYGQSQLETNEAYKKKFAFKLNILNITDPSSLNQAQQENFLVTFYPNGSFEISETKRLWLENSKCYQEGIVSGHLHDGLKRTSILLGFKVSP